LGIFGRKPKQPSAAEDRPPADEINLRQELPTVFGITLREHLVDDEEVLGVLFVPSERILSEWYPGKALIVTSHQLITMEEGETSILDTKWGVRTRLYSYDHIAAIEMGHVLLIGRMKIICANPQQDFEFRLHWYDLNNFRAALKLIREKMAAVKGRSEERDRG
jgi:hypothetical protein